MVRMRSRMRTMTMVAKMRDDTGEGPDPPLSLW